MTTNIQYHIVPAKSHTPTVQVRVGDQPSFYLHSSIHPREEAEEWVKRLELTPNTCYIILGAGLGYHIQALLKNLPTNSQVCILMTRSETELVNYGAVRFEYNWLTDERIFILFLATIHDMAVLIANRMIKHTIKTICLCRCFPAMRLAESNYEEIEVNLVTSLRHIMAINFNMKVVVEHTFLLNYWKNFPYYILSPSSYLWENSFADLPVIIVAAGPSLNKNIAELKKCADKAVIIAAGSALGALHKHGIIPHFLVVTDGNPIMYEELKNFFSTETVLVVTTSVEPQVVVNYPGPKCFFDTWLGYNGDLKKYLPETMWISQTGSVATATVDFANKCGARTIILIGQDLAFPKDSHHHADGVLAGGFGNWPIIKVPGYYGEEVDSTDHFKVIIEYYNEYVKSNSHIRFVNATEGGALIEAMCNMSLENVHQQMLKNPIDKESLMTIFKHRNEEVIQLKKIMKHLQKMSNWIENLSDQLRAFHNQEEIIANQCQTVQCEIVHQDIQRFEIFCKKMKQRKIYPYIATSVDSWLSLLNFQVADGMPIDQQYEFYWNITRDVQRMMIELKASLTETIKIFDRYERGLS